MENMLEFYTDYLICSTGQTSAEGLSRLVDKTISHDSVTRFLSKPTYDSKLLWQRVKPLVRQHESEEACLVFDDCIIEKAHTDENPLICWHWDHAKKRNVKGINFLSAFYVTQKDGESTPVRLPVCYELILKTILFCTIKDKKVHRKSPVTKNELMQTMIQQCIHNQLKFKYILADSWFASTENMHFVADKKKLFIFDLQDNRLALLADDIDEKPNTKSPWTNIKSLDISNNKPVKVWLKGMDFPVLVTKQIFKNEEDQTTGLRFLVSNDFSLTDDQFTTIYKKRWSVEEYHKSLKQNASIAKSPTRTVTTQSNHFFCAIWAYVKLEKLKFKTKLNHFEIKAKIYLKALKAAHDELATINSLASPA
jgi:DDE superfamily endonuclease